jgi:AGCS family alanine or glycine:cation symporter
LQALEHLLEQVGNVVWGIAVMVGSVASLKMVWSFADITNGLMALPNLISLIVLNKVIVSETREHLWNTRA